MAQQEDLSNYGEPQTREYESLARLKQSMNGTIHQMRKKPSAAPASIKKPFFISFKKYCSISKDRSSDKSPLSSKSSSSVLWRVRLYSSFQSDGGVNVFLTWNMALYIRYQKQPHFYCFFLLTMIKNYLPFLSSYCHLGQNNLKKAWVFYFL